MVIATVAISVVMGVLQIIGRAVHSEPRSALGAALGVPNICAAE